MTALPAELRALISTTARGWHLAVKIFSPSEMSAPCRTVHPAQVQCPASSPGD
jgi:hypothetical protein